MSISTCSYQLSTDVTNATGNGDHYYMIADTERWDYANNYNSSTGVFTAPYTGVYHVDFQFNINNIKSTNYNCWCAIETAARLWAFADGNPYVGRSAPSLEGTFNIGGSADIYLAANDTMKVFLIVNYTDKTITIKGDGTNPITFINVRYVGPAS